MMKRCIFLIAISLTSAISAHRAFAVDGHCELNVEVGDDDDPCIVVNNIINNKEQIPDSKYYDECTLSKIIYAIENAENGDHYCKFDDSSDYNKNARVIGFQPEGMPADSDKIPYKSTLTEISVNKNSQIELNVKEGETWLFTGSIFLWDNGTKYDVCLGDPNDDGECKALSNWAWCDEWQCAGGNDGADDWYDYRWDDKFVEGEILGQIGIKENFEMPKGYIGGGKWMSGLVTVLDPYLNSWGKFTPPNWDGNYCKIKGQYRADILTDITDKPAIVLKGSGTVIFRDINFIAKKQIMEIDGPTVYFERVTIQNVADVELEQLIRVKSGALIFGNKFGSPNFADPNLAVYTPCEQADDKTGVCTKIAEPTPPKAYIRYANKNLVSQNLIEQKFEYNDKTAPWFVDDTSEIPCVKINDKQCKIESLEYDTNDNTKTCNEYPCFAEHSRTYKATINDHGPAKLKKLKTKTVPIDTVLYTKCAAVDYSDGSCDSASPYIGHKLKLVDEVKLDITCDIDDGNANKGFPSQVKLKSSDDGVNVKCKITLGNGWKFGAGNKAWIWLDDLPSYLVDNGLEDDGELYFNKEFDIKQGAKDAEFSAKIPKSDIKKFGIPLLIASTQNITVSGNGFEGFEKYLAFQRKITFIENDHFICSDGTYLTSCQCEEEKKWDSATASCVTDCGTDADVKDGKCECKVNGLEHNPIFNICYDPSVGGGADGKKEYDVETNTWVCKDKIEGANSSTCACPAGTIAKLDINDGFKNKCMPIDDGKNEGDDEEELPEDICTGEGLELNGDSGKCVCQDGWHWMQKNSKGVIACSKNVEPPEPPTPSCNASAGEVVKGNSCVCDTVNDWLLSSASGKCEYFGGGNGGDSAPTGGCGLNIATGGNAVGTAQNFAMLLPYLALLIGLKARRLFIRLPERKQQQY